jgi:hypothetical protein
LLRVGGEGLVHVGASVALDDDLRKAAARAGVGGLQLEHSGGSRLLRFARLPAG